MTDGAKDNRESASLSEPRSKKSAVSAYNKKVNGWNKDWETDNIPDDMSGVHVETCLSCDMPTPEHQPNCPQNRPSRGSFWVIERFENEQSQGYWAGDSSRDFVKEIDKAIQFRRRDDAWRIKRGWHWKDTKVTEHLYMQAAEPRREAPDSINYLEIHHTDGRVTVWYGEEAQGRFRGIDHDPTTKEEWKQMAGEGVRTIEALTEKLAGRDERELTLLNVKALMILYSDQYPSATPLNSTDELCHLIGWCIRASRASAAPLKQTVDEAPLKWCDCACHEDGGPWCTECFDANHVNSASQPQPSADQVIFHSLREVAQSHHFDTDGVCTRCNMSDLYTQSYGIMCPSAGQTEGK